MKSTKARFHRVEYVWDQGWLLLSSFREAFDRELELESCGLASPVNVFTLRLDCYKLVI